MVRAAVAADGVPVTVMGTFWLSGAFADAVTVTVKLSPGTTVDGFTVAVVPDGRPLRVRSTV
jgi:alkylation response protein AidB-like acyl-CoA dehydrogenase